MIHIFFQKKAVVGQSVTLQWVCLDYVDVPIFAVFVAVASNWISYEYTPSSTGGGACYV